MRAKRLAMREMQMRFVFTVLEPCGEQKYWCGPSFGFTGRISAPSLLKNLILLQGKNDFTIPEVKTFRRQTLTIAAQGGALPPGWAANRTIPTVYRTQPGWARPAPPAKTTFP